MKNGVAKVTKQNWATFLEVFSTLLEYQKYRELLRGLLEKQEELEQIWAEKVTLEFLIQDAKEQRAKQNKKGTKGGA